MALTSLAALGFIGYYAASFLDFIGLKYVGAGVGRLILYLYPTLVLLISFLFLHRRPTRRQLGALVITYAGVAFILSSQLRASGTSPSSARATTPIGAASTLP